MRIYQLHVSLRYIAPPIWRRLEIPGDMTFAALHDVLQTAMGWKDCHLWTFSVGKTEIEIPEPGGLAMPGMPSSLSALRTTVDRMLDGHRVKFRYMYDMGDSWLHEIKVEKVGDPDPDVQYPRCTGGARACPPEDCGGFPGYMNILEAISNPKYPDREETLEWIGEDFDPEAFDIDAVNSRLQPRKRKSRSATKK